MLVREDSANCTASTLQMKQKLWACGSCEYSRQEGIIAYSAMLGNVGHMA